MFKHLFLILVLVFGLSSVTCLEQQHLQNELSSCVERLEGNKIYLKPSSAYIAKNGIFINLSGELHPVNHLEVDASGVYIDVTRLDLGDLIVGECSICSNITLFGICTNPRCPSRQ